MCGRSLFGGNNCEWIIWALIIWFVLSSICDNDCGCATNSYPRSNGCGCGCD